MNSKQITFILTYISFLFLVACSREPEFEKFGFWIEAPGTKLEIPIASYEPMFSGTNGLRKNAIDISSGDNGRPKFYYYGDIPASMLKLVEIGDKDIAIGVDIVPLKQSGAYQITPKTSLSKGGHYAFLLGSQAYSLHVK